VLFGGKERRGEGGENMGLLGGGMGIRYLKVKGAGLFGGFEGRVLRGLFVVGVELECEGEREDMVSLGGLGGVGFCGAM
jgi:hypothetical protein